MEDILVKPALSEVEWDGIWASKTINQFFGVLSNVLSKVDIGHGSCGLGALWPQQRWV